MGTRKHKQWETLRFSQWFWFSPKTKIRKKQKTSKANFQCSKICLFLVVFCELWKLSLQAVRAVWCDRRVTVLGCVSHDKNNSICIHKNSSMQQRMCTLFSQIAWVLCLNPNNNLGRHFGSSSVSMKTKCRCRQWRVVWCHRQGYGSCAVSPMT